MKTGEIVVVRYTDPTFRHGWQDKVEAANLTPLTMKVHGVLLNKDKKNTVIAALVEDSQEQVSEVYIIPNGCIIKIKTLKEA